MRGIIGRRSTSVAALVSAAVIAGPVVAASAATIAAVAAQADEETSAELSVDKPSGNSSWTPISAHATAPDTEAQVDFAAKGRSDGYSRLLEIDVTMPNGEVHRDAGDNHDDFRITEDDSIGEDGSSGGTISIPCQGYLIGKVCALDEGPDAFAEAVVTQVVSDAEDIASDPGAYVDIVVEAVEGIDPAYEVSEVERLAGEALEICEYNLETLGIDGVCMPATGEEG